MDSEISYSNVVINKYPNEKEMKEKITNDIIIPDSKPDVIKIISSCAHLKIKEKYIHKGQITISGVINYEITYLADSQSDKIKTINYQSPFSCQNDFFELSEGDTTSLVWKVLKCEATVNNSRKITVNTWVSVTVYPVSNQIADMFDFKASKNISIEHIGKKVTPFNRVICAEDDFEICDEIESGDFLVCEIIKTDSHAFCTEYKVINNKIVLKGILSVCIVFLDDECNLRSIGREFDFANVIDAENVTPDMIADANIEITSFETENLSGDENYSVEFSASLHIGAVVYDEFDIDMVCDAYCPDYKSILTKKKMNVYELLCMGSDRVNIKETVEFDNKSCTKVCFVSPYVSVNNCTIENRKLKIEGVLTVYITYIAKDNTLMCVQKKDIKFENYTDAVNCESSDIPKVNAYVKDLEFLIMPSDRVEIKAVIILEQKVLRYTECEYITNVEIDYESPYDKTLSPSISVYFTEKGDDLYNIAKKYHTTVDEIMVTNSIKPDCDITNFTSILIPKRG